MAADKDLLIKKLTLANEYLQKIGSLIQNKDAGVSLIESFDETKDQKGVVEAKYDADIQAAINDLKIVVDDL